MVRSRVDDTFASEPERFALTLSLGVQLMATDAMEIVNFAPTLAGKCSALLQPPNCSDIYLDQPLHVDYLATAGSVSTHPLVSFSLSLALLGVASIVSSS